jgi:hypothetical protein
VPSNPSDPENRQWEELTWVETSTDNNELGYTEASEMQEIVLDGRRKGLAGIRAGNCDPSRSMAVPKLSANSPGQISLEGGLEGGTNMSRRSSVITNREDSKNNPKGKVVYTPPLIFDIY